MSRFRRIGLAATAAAAVLALAVPTGASAISINAVPIPPSTAPTALYNVTATASGATFFDMAPASTGGTTAVVCTNSDNGMPVSGKYGWGATFGTERTMFAPRFQKPSPTVGGGCEFVDHNGNYSSVSFSFIGGMNLDLTELAPGENPSSPQRKYNGRLYFVENTGMAFDQSRYPGCYVRIDGPQSVNLPPGKIVVDDNTDRIDVDVSYASFTLTKTAACPSTIGNSVTIWQTPGHGWRLNNVTVTP